MRDSYNLFLAAVSSVFLIHALFSLKKVVKGIFAVDTWQMFLHVTTYFLVFVSGIVLLTVTIDGSDTK